MLEALSFHLSYISSSFLSFIREHFDPTVHLSVFFAVCSQMAKCTGRSLVPCVKICIHDLHAGEHFRSVC